MKKTKKNKKMFSLHNEILFYLLSVVIILFVTGIVFLLGPLILLQQNVLLISILIITGIGLGAFLKNFFKDLESLLHHHVSTWLIILISSILNFTSLTMTFQKFGVQQIFLNSFLLATIFTASFITPFLIKKNFFKHKRKHE